MAFGLAQGLGDFFGEFSDESGKIRQANERKASEDSAIEQRALEHLANADDPQIRAAAVTAMLTPKKGSGGSVLAKWYGQQRDHPVFDQVHSLINGGTQPFMGAEEKAAQQRAGTITGAARGVAQGMREEGMEPPPGMIEGVVRGAAGAPQRTAAPKAGTLVMKDGTHMAATQQADGLFYDQYGDAINDEIAEWHPSGTGLTASDTNKHGSWVTFKGGDGKYYKQFTTAEGVKQGTPVETVPPLAPPNQIFQTPTGFEGVAPGRAGGAPPRRIPVIGGEAPTRTEDPSANFTAIRQTAKDIESRAAATVPKFGGMGQDPKEMGAALDREAVVAGYPNWAAVQAAVKAAQEGVSGAVQGAPPSGIDLTAPPASTLPSGRGGAPTKPGAKPVGKKKAAIPGALDVNKILAELDKFQ